MAASDFQQDVLTTACEPDEMIVAVRFPLHAPGEGCAFAEFDIRHGDFAIVAVAVLANADRAAGSDRRLFRSTARHGISATRRRRTRREAERLGVVAAVRRRSPRQRTLPPQSGAHPGAADGGGGDAMPGLSEHVRQVDTAQPTWPRCPLRSNGTLAAPTRGKGSSDAQIEPPQTRHRVTVILNGRHAEGDAAPRLLLSDFLRHELGATGVHVGCEHGICGACTVRVDGELARACLMLAVQADGTTIETVEGLERRRGAVRASGGVPAPSRAAVRLLHAGHPDVVCRSARTRARAGRGPHPRGARRAPVPVHRLRHHRRRGARRGTALGDLVRRLRRLRRLRWSIRAESLSALPDTDLPLRAPVRNATPLSDATSETPRCSTSAAPSSTSPNASRPPSQSSTATPPSPTATGSSSRCVRWPGSMQWGCATATT